MNRRDVRVALLTTRERRNFHARMSQQDLYQFQRRVACRSKYADSNHLTTSSGMLRSMRASGEPASFAALAARRRLALNKMMQNVSLQYSYDLNVAKPPA